MEHICELCGGAGEVSIIPYGKPDSAEDSYGCPACIQKDRDEAENKLDTANARIAYLEQRLAAKCIGQGYEK